MRDKVIIVSDGYTTNLFVNGNLYGNHITAINYEHDVDNLKGPCLKVTVDTMPVQETGNLENFKKSITSMLGTQKGEETMTEENMRTILDAMQGLNFLEWNKLKDCIDAQFRKESSNRNRGILISDTDTIVTEYKRNFTLF